jgi:hypothetical protein
MGMKNKPFDETQYKSMFPVEISGPERLLEAVENGKILIQVSDEDHTCLVSAQYDCNMFILANFNIRQLIIDYLKRQIREMNPANPHVPYEQAIDRTKRGDGDADV